LKRSLVTVLLNILDFRHKGKHGLIVIVAILLPKKAVILFGPSLTPSIA
jgi:hypothetical protein